MKKNSILWAALSMTAALVMTACSNDDNDMTEAPVAPSTSKTIPYTVTVGGDEATTRATVDGNNKTLRFATGDKLYITGTNIQGVLDLQAGGAGETNNVTFSGDLTYTGDGTPADGLSLTATLVSAQQTLGTQVSVDGNGAVTVNYPTTAYCSSINDAVQKYSNLTGTSTYGARAFTLTQQTAFLNFEITFDDGTVTETPLTAVVSNGGSAIATLNVTTETVSEKVVAKFVLPLAAGTTLSSATVTMGDKEAISFGASQKLTGKIYNISRSVTPAGPTAYSLAESTVGMIVGSDGKAYAVADKDNLPSGVTAVAKIVYVGSDNGESAPYNNGLALALSDANGGSNCKWKTEQNDAGHTYKPTSSSSFSSESGLQYNETHNSDTYPAFKAAIANNGTAAPTGCSAWFLASGYQWVKMADAAGGYTALRDGFSSVGGSNLQSVNYWSSSEYGSSSTGAWHYSFSNGSWKAGMKGNSLRVRACLAF